jgi:hypothetical protein
MRFPVSLRVGACALVAAFLSACGGAGTSGPAPLGPPVTSTPAPGTLSVPGVQSSGGAAGGFVNDGKNPSTYTVTSNPIGQTFTLGGRGYTTPVTVTPAASTNALAIVFSDGLRVPIVQVYDGPHGVFYNAAGASSGSVAAVSLQSLRRATPAATAPLAAAVRRRVTTPRGVRPDVDPTRLAVRMSAAALRSSGRTPADIERSVGASGHATLSATSDALRVVNVPIGVDGATFARELRAQPEVLEVSPVHRRYLLARAPTTVTDPYFTLPDQWYSFATGTDYAWSYDPGTGARLAIIDTGIDENNTDLASQLGYAESAVTPIDDTPDAANGGNPTCMPLSNATTVVTPNVAQDDNGHGTDVAGIAIAKADTAGFAGAAWGATLLAFKIFPTQTAFCNDTGLDYGADTADEARAIADAIAQRADVISLSLGGEGGSIDSVEFNAIESAIAAGVTVVAAAGNDEDGSGPGTLDYPAAFPGVISVGASALRDEYSATINPTNSGSYATAVEYVPTYSQYGPSLGVVAPGGDASSEADGDVLHWIANYSTSTAFEPDQQCGTPSPATSCTALFNGTSMATPQVSATVAMLVAEAGGHRRLTPAQIQYAIESTADNINDPHQGHGRLNAYRALASLIRDSSAYSGPIAHPAGMSQLIAFAYAKGDTNKPVIVDATFTAGVPVADNGTFLIADVPLSAGAYRVAVWYDADGDGVIDAGDQIGIATAQCYAALPCALGSIVMHAVAPGFYLP